MSSLTGIYQEVDGTKIGRLELVKSLASRILKLSQGELGSILAKVNIIR